MDHLRKPTAITPLDLASQLAETDALSLLSTTANSMVDRPVNSTLSSARRAHIVEGSEGDVDGAKTTGRLTYLIHTQMSDTDSCKQSE